MRSLASRIKRVEEAVGGIKQPPLILWMEPGETDEECFARHGVEEDPDRLNILIVKWADGPPDLPLSGQQQAREPAADVDQQITAILSELKAEGLTDEQIEAALLEAKVTENGQNEQISRVRFSHRETSEKQADAGPQPNRAEELIRMFRRR
jgi:hypothetical protein